MRGRLAAVLFGVLFAGVLAFSVCTPPSEAQTSTAPISPTDGLDRAERLRVFTEVLRGSESSDPVKRNASRRILTRALGQVAEKPILRFGTRAGLVGLAVGSWAVVGYEVKYALDLGSEETVSVPLRLQPATGASWTKGINGDNTTGRVLFAKRLYWEIHQPQGSTGWRIKSDLATLVFVESYVKTTIAGGCSWNSSGGSLGARPLYAYKGTNPNGSSTCDAPPSYDPAGTYSTTNASWSSSTDYSYQSYVAQADGSGSWEWQRDLCDSGPCSFTHDFPTFKVGGSSPVESLASPADYTSTGTEADDIVDSVVTDPEAPTVVPELPPADDPFWDDPDAPKDPTPEEDPAYPEQPTIPDPDDPFWTDPAPADEPGYDPNAPSSDPDEDGESNEGDQDDDGDGIPDEDDPKPYVPTDPTTLPQDHPYADPDDDGQPNRTDGDDDGDGSPDTEDPAPYDPEVTPEPDPDADSDGDGVPDTIDPAPGNRESPQRYTQTDTDGDGSPDTYDPAPNDPASPQTNPEPGSDSDGDGTPNEHDPFPENPTYPQDGPNGDPDQDGTPNRSDPDPYRPEQPTGGPSGDPDGDGTPNGEDPYPQDPNRPNDGTNNCSCPQPIKAKFDVPGINIGSVFPFSLVVWAFDQLGELNEEPRLPVWELPVLGEVDFNRFSAIFSGIKGVVTFFCVVGMVLLWYAYIKGSEA